MKKEFLIILAVLSIVTISVQYVIINKQNTKGDVLNQELEYISQRNDQKLVYWESKRLSEIKAEGANFKLDNVQKKEQNEDEWTPTFPKVVFRFFQTNCSPCIDVEIENIEKIADSLSYSNICVVVDGLNNREIKSFQKEHPLLKIFASKDGMISNNPIENNQNPYYFMLTKNNTIQGVFVPDPVTPSITQNYLRSQLIKLKIILKTPS